MIFEATDLHCFYYLPNLTNILSVGTSKAQKTVTFSFYFYKSLMREGFETFYFQPMEAVRFYDRKNRHLEF